MEQTQGREDLAHHGRVCQIDLSRDGATPGFTAGGGTLNPPGNASINAQFYYLVQGTSAPAVAPLVRLSALVNQINMPVHVNKVGERPVGSRPLLPSPERGGKERTGEL